MGLAGTDIQKYRVCIPSFMYGKCFFAFCFVEILIDCRYWANSVFTVTRAMHKARDTIVELAKFYGISIRTDEESESDATEVMLSSGSVDQYMEALLDEWGMDWHKLLKLGTQLLQPQTQQAGAKRAGDASSRGEEKKIRGGREEEVDYSRAESI